VAQQSKARRKDDFLIAFSPVIAEATASAYKGATNEVQQKLRRVVEVWRQRQIFEIPIQDAIEARIEGMLRYYPPRKTTQGLIISRAG
jgi:regulator of Ty1 transposition protein 103